MCTSDVIFFLIVNMFSLWNIKHPFIAENECTHIHPHAFNAKMLILHSFIDMSVITFMFCVFLGNILWKQVWIYLLLYNWYKLEPRIHCKKKGNSFMSPLLLWYLVCIWNWLITLKFTVKRRKSFCSTITTVTSIFQNILVIYTCFNDLLSRFYK